jgi:TolB-like protein
VGPYKLLRELGEGGFGIVYEAEQTLPVRRRVALKVIKPGMDTREVIARFDGERQALARMDHPHIAKVFGAGANDDGRPYFVMELVKGEPATDYCNARALGIDERLALFVQVCEAVQHAHASGIIHRDLKPGNVLVATSDGRPFTKVIDFGIAKAISGRLGEHSVYTQKGMLIGTPLYMSPEQMLGAPDIDARTDVYALGVILYELLTGATPFAAGQLRGVDHGEMQRVVREVDPPRPSSRVSTLRSTAGRCGLEPGALARKLRGELDWIVMRALEKDRARRYASAAELGEDVRRFLDGEPVLAGPPGMSYRLGKFLRRHRAALVAGTVIAVLLAVLAVIAWPGRGVAPPREKSIAVLPFADLGGGGEDAYFALGLHDELLADLAKVADLRVIARGSVMPYRGTTKAIPQVADELGVEMVLDGTVQRVGDRVRIRVALNDAGRNAVVWSQRFETEPTAENLVAIQSTITRAIATELGAHVSAAESESIDDRPTRSTPAYEAYLRGRALSHYGENSQAELLQAAAAFEVATAEDAAFAEAYAAKAIVHLSLLWSGHDRRGNIVAARVALDAANRLAPDSADTLVALGYYHYWGFYDYARAEAAVARAVAVAPGSADAWTLRASIARRALRFDDAIAAYERSIELDPLRPGSTADLAYALGLGGQLPRARVVAAEAAAQAPGSPYVIGCQIHIALLTEDAEGAWRMAKQFPVLDSGAYDYARTTLALYSRDPVRLQALLATWPAPRSEPPFHDTFDVVRAFALRQMGEIEQSRALLDRVRPRLEAALDTDPLDDESRKLIVAVYALDGDLPRLRAANAALRDAPPKDNLWLVEEGFVDVLGNALAGEGDTAFDLLEQGMDRAGDAQFSRARLSPAFDALRTHPRYLALQARWERSRGAQVAR